MPIEDIKILVIGGWKKNSASFSQGEKIIAYLERYSIKTINYKHMYSKMSYGPFEYAMGCPEEQRSRFSHENVLVNAKTGKTYFTGFDSLIEHQQGLRNIAYEEMLTAEFGDALPTTQYPLKEVS